MNKVLDFLGLTNIFNRKPWGRFFSVIAFLGLVGAIVVSFYVNSFLKSGRIKDEVAKHYPENLVLEMKDGLLDARGIDMPYTLGKSDDDDSASIYIDTNKKVSLSLLEEMGIDEGMIITQDGIIAQKNSGEIRLFPFPKDGGLDFVLTKEIAVKESAHSLSKIRFGVLVGLFISSLVFMCLGLSVVYLWSILIASFLVWLLSLLVKRKLAFEDIFEAFVQVAPLIMLVDIILLYYGYGRYFFTLVTIAIVLIGVFREVKTQKVLG